LPAALTGKMKVCAPFEAPDLDSLFLVIQGRPGCGKSSLVASNPRCLLFDLEKNAGTVIDPAAERVEVRPTSTTAAKDIRAGVDGFLSAYRTDTALREAFSTIAFDSYDRLVEIFQHDLCREHGIEDPGEYKTGHGKGYFKVRDELFDMFERILRAGLGVVLTAHLGPQDIRIPGKKEPETHITLSVSKTFRNQLVRTRHMMFRIECQPVKVKKKTKGGVVLDLPSDDPTAREYVLITDTSTNPGDFDSPKATVPMGSSLVIPAVGGWQAIRNAYFGAVEVRRNQDRALDTAAPKGNNQPGARK
jgi:hypothetical protein